MKAFLYILLLSLPFFLTAQHHDKNWMFTFDNIGPTYSSTLFDFSVSPAKTIEYESNLQSIYSILLMSDSAGNPLFFTNGFFINHSNGKKMMGGDTLNAGTYFEQFGNGYYGQLMLCLPSTEKGNFDLFHLTYGQAGSALESLLHTKIIDAINDSTGTVQFKNKRILIDSILGNPAANRHANGQDWWLIVPNGGEDGSYVYNSFYFDGEDIQRKQQFFTETLDETFFLIGSGGQKAFSNDGTKYADMVSGLGELNIFDFDRCRGTLSNLVAIKLPTFLIGTGLAFSPNNRFLYVSEHKIIIQFDLWAYDIAASKDTVAIYDYDEYVHWHPNGLNFITWQNGSDGKIYCTSPVGTNRHVYINKPNKKGVACDVRMEGLEVKNRAWHGPRYPHYRLGPIDDSPCDTLGLDNHPLADFWWYIDPNETGNGLEVEFVDNSSYEPIVWFWYYGDGSPMHQTQNPVHTFPDSGTYTVCLKICNTNSCDTICKDVTVQSNSVSSYTLSSKDMSAQVYPNPAQDFIQFKYSMKSKGTLQFFDAQGKLLQSRTLRQQKGNLMYDISNYTAGLYFYTFSDKKGNLLQGKFVVE